VRELAEHITAELAPHLPPRISIEVDAERIALHERGRMHCTVALPDVSDPLECGWLVLGTVQDLLCDHLHAPWPLLPDGRPTYAGPSGTAGSRTWHFVRATVPPGSSWHRSRRCSRPARFEPCTDGEAMHRGTTIVPAEERSSCGGGSQPRCGRFGGRHTTSAWLRSTGTRSRR